MSFVFSSKSFSELCLKLLCRLTAILLCTCAWAPSAALAVRVLIDPGHGGIDKGAAQGRVTEADVVWLWSLDLKKVLLERGFEVVMSRSETSGLTISKRMALVQKTRPDLVISLHANYLLDSRVRGVEYYVASPLDLEDQKLQLAHEEVLLKTGARVLRADVAPLKEEQRVSVSAILNDLEKQSRMEESLRFAERMKAAWPGKIKQGPFNLLENSEAPALLIELGFLSNPVDLSQLTDPNFRLEKNLKIADVVAGYFSSMGRAPARTRK